MAMTTATAMSDAEKAQQMSGLPQSGTANYDVFRQEDNASRGIKAFFFRDGPRGVNLSANSDNKQDYSTAFPVAIARGAAFDDQLEYQIGMAIGDEMLASGNTMMLAPTVNILRHPAWGRAQETYGEDVFLLGRLGSAFVQGIQQYAAACAKHYAANNIENGRETAVATMTRADAARDLRAPLRDDHPGGRRLLDHGRRTTRSASRAARRRCTRRRARTCSTTSCATDFGFKGFVLSDWWAMPNGNSVPLPVGEHAAADRASRPSRPAWIWSCPGDTTTRRCPTS